jgi:hypothetical protein
MSKPLWIPCPSVDDVPSVSQLQQLVTDEQHVVLKLLVTPDDKGTAVDKPSIIQHLARQLPDFTVFDSGGKSGESTWITIKKVIAGEDVLANAEAILAAMRLFRATARDLMGRLAQQLNVFHDTRRALKILEQHGHLRQISSPSENRVGLIAPVTRREVGPCESP